MRNHSSIFRFAFPLIILCSAFSIHLLKFIVVVFSSHTGVAHLARTFVRKLRDLQAELNISEVDCLCVEVAGLCHDLGHGPFSHLFDGIILPMLGE